MRHDLCVWILWYLDDWLLLASCKVEALWAKDKVLALLPTWHCDKPRKVVSQCDSDCYLLRDGDREPLFGGFSFPGEGFDPALTDH